MSLGTLKECFLRLKWSPTFLSQRFRRINVNRPRAPHYERAKVLALLKPQYKEDPSIYLPPALKCLKQERIQKKASRVDNPLEHILAKELMDTCESSKMIAILHKNPINAADNFDVKVKLKRENMKLETFSKHIVKLAFDGTRYEKVLQLFVAHNAFVFCKEPKVETLINILKKVPQYILLAAIVDDRLLSVSQLQTYVRLKDITTARSLLVSQLNNASSNIVTQLNQQQSLLITRLKQITDKDSDSK